MFNFKNILLCLIILFSKLSFIFSFTNFILVGSTGDLSKKYLWEALFIQYIENNIGDSMMIYAGATRSESEGLPIIKSSLNSLHCKESWSIETCENGLIQFKSKVIYVRLKNSADYELLNSKLNENNNNNNNNHETLRIFYLSVSPSLYQDIATSINNYARPKGELRVVFEKPFGMDLQSAIELSNQLSLNLKESEIYRVDHYLGKVGMKAIIDFRGSNLDLLSSLKYPSLQTSSNNLNNEKTCEITSPINLDLNNSNLPLVEVVMKEMEDTAGRSVYYDQFGVIRDVMQNHLTQALVYSLMDLSIDLNINDNHIHNNNKETFGRLSDRLYLLKELKYTSSFQNHETCSVNSIVDNDQIDGLWLGQYADYIDHLEQDLIEYARKSSTIPPTEVSSKTPTAASVIFELNMKNSANNICQDINRVNENQNENDSLRILVSAGKALDLREMYVQLRSSKDLNCSIIFGVQGGLNKHINQLTSDSGPYILLNGNCWIQNEYPQIIIPSEWSVSPSLCNYQFYNRINNPIGSIDNYNKQETDKISCILRPNYIFESQSISSSSSSSTTTKTTSTIEKTANYSNKFRNNAYIEILGALLRNDRSYFTTTDELLSQWKIWDSVLKDSQCENIEPYHIGWNGLD